MFKGCDCVGFRILEGVIEEIVLTRELCEANVGVLYKASKRVFKGLTMIIECYTSVCVERKFDDQGKLSILC
jgi:hypothetical protein